MVILFLGLLGSGIYFLFKDSHFNREYILNKYSDIKNWCTTENDNEILKINCQGLLLDIRNMEDETICFDMQIITKQKELKDISICEKSDVLIYTNDMLQYKKLMPTDITFLYTKEKTSNQYSFHSVNLAKLDDTHIQAIVNEDIAELVTLNQADTTIQNSVDFCPLPEKLPNYITTDNKSNYTNYYIENILDESEYGNVSLYNLDDSTIELLYGCDSRKTRGLTPCSQNRLLKTSNITKSLRDESPNTVSMNAPLSETVKYLLKEISLFYDGIEYEGSEKKEDLIISLVKYTSANKDINPELYCGIYKLLSLNNEFLNSEYMQKIYSTIITDINVSPYCQEIYKETTDPVGLYIKGLYQTYDSNFKIQKRCVNLNNLIQNTQGDE